jgi:hypothetical protein
MTKYGTVEGWDIEFIPHISFTDEYELDEFFAHTVDRFVSDFEAANQMMLPGKTYDAPRIFGYAGYKNVIIWTKKPRVDWSGEEV